MWTGTGNRSSRERDHGTPEHGQTLFTGCYSFTQIIQSAEYAEWLDMRERCTNKCHPHYNDFGGIGAKICDRWCLSFSEFMRDMGEMPTTSPKKVDSPTANANKKYAYILERMDCTKEYCKENCRWALRVDHVLHFKYTRRSSRVHAFSASTSMASSYSERSEALLNHQATPRPAFDLLEPAEHSMQEIPPISLGDSEQTHENGHPVLLLKNICKMS
jgi:hypothetical protein